ncbi:glutathione peroxidase [Paenibacillus pasadenensis]|uniref:glutathione peroxidase n=1 Tax=Paenibacillus pasadenensis TaxID=217090 RepID=UPI00203F71C0|nr:glutathione peroxidase [Paenibacillus pasadenensis]MCM3747657.1 glutathione peroxidase [Paenibacillus pasadenensis]
MAALNNYKLETLKGEGAQVEDYKGKVLLIVNTASKCGLTPQYEGLQALYNEYKDQGLEILGFPSNQFAGQEPGSSDEIEGFCQLNYGVTFPLFAKTDVNGENAHPLFQQLTSEAPFQGFDSSPSGQRFAGMFSPEQLQSNDVKWNFTKFLVGRNGEIVARFEPNVLPQDITGEIEKQL